jgi:hypothetical protein
MKLAKAIFGAVFALVGFFGTLVSLGLAIGRTNEPQIHNPDVLLAYALLFILGAGVLLIHSAEKE